MKRIEKNTYEDQKMNWETPVISPMGKVTNLVLVGLGKLSPPAVDPGEPKKTQPDG